MDAFVLVDIHILLIPVCLILAAIFAAAEASFFSLSRTQLEALREQRPHIYRQLDAFISAPDALLSTLIISNECLNILIGTFVVSLIEGTGVFEERGVAIVSILISSALLLTCSEVLPKIVAFRVPVLVASLLVYPVRWVHTLIAPIRRIFLSISRQITRALGVQPTSPSVVSEKDFLTLVEVGAESGSLEKEERERIINVFSFSDKTVSSVMTPWEKVFFLREDLPLPELLGEIKKHPFSRIPVLSPTGTVLGVLHVKELLPYVLDHQTSAKDFLKEAMFQPYVVSTHARIARLFKEFKQKKLHMALVVDEYGKQLGLITLEDVLNALFQTRKPLEGVKSG